MTGEERKINRDKMIDISIYFILIFIVLISLDRIFLLDFGLKINYNSDLFYGKVITEYGGSLLLTFIPQKILTFIILFFSGYSMYEFVDKIVRQRMAKFYAGLLYIFNPYVYIRIVSGQLWFLFSYAILPLLLKIFIGLLEKKDKKEMIKFTLLLSIVAFNIHMLIISLIMMTIIFIFWFNKYKDIKITKLLAMSGILFILLNSYWIIPVLTAKNTIVDNITDKDYEVYAPKGRLFEIAAMYGSWREGYIYAKDFIPGWQILYLIILSLSILGFLTYYKDEKIGYLVMAFGFIAILGLILALGIKGPLSILYEFDNPILKGFRDSHKFVAMMVLSYAVLGGLGINKLGKIKEEYKEI